MTQYICRIAPSPTGDMHLGTARTAYFNWLLARATGGEFILRIDDTDLDRNKEEHVAVIKETLNWLHLDPNRYFRQSDRDDVYKRALNDLRSVDATTTLENGAVALRCPDNLPSEFEDIIAGMIPITQTNKDQIHNRLILARGGDKIGQVTYQFASVVDDYMLGVNMICRGTDHISNTPKQIAIWTALNQAAPEGQVWITPRPLPKFAHVGLIMKDGKKLSKRDGAASMLHYKKLGIHPEAMLNFMLRLGWSPKQDDRTNAIITRDKAITIFLSEGKMRNTNANFDEAKLNWYDRWYKRN